MELLSTSDIRIVRPQKKLYEKVKKLAEENKRTIGKQAEYMIQQLINKKHKT